MYRHREESIFQINTGHRHSLLNNFKNIIQRLHFKMLIIYKFRMVLKEPSFFCLVKIVKTKLPLSRSHSMMTPLAKSFLIYVFMILISCSVSGTLGADVFPGLSLKLSRKPFLITSRSTLSLVTFRHTVQ